MLWALGGARVHNQGMKTLFLLALLTLPVCAEVRSLSVDDIGVVSVNWASSEQNVQSLALEGRDEPSQSWRSLGVWSLVRNGGMAAKMHLETLPGSQCAEYRVLTFGPTGFTAKQSYGGVGKRIMENFLPSALVD